MLLKQLTSKIWQNKDKLLNKTDFPNKIVLPGDQTGGILGFGAKNVFWQSIEELRTFTDKGSEKFSQEHQGSTGWEYEMIMAYVNGRFFYSRPTTSKNYSQVSSSHSLKVETVREGSILTDKIKINGKFAGRIQYSTQKEQDKRNESVLSGDYQVGFVCHFHTHPKIVGAASTAPYYTFFSPQDIHSFASSGAPLMGLVTDRLWVIGKTRESVNALNGYLPELGNDLSQVSFAEKRGNEEFMNAAGEFFRKYQLAGYSSAFGGSLQRVE